MKLEKIGSDHQKIIFLARASAAIASDRKNGAASPIEEFEARIQELWDGLEQIQIKIQAAKGVRVDGMETRDKQMDRLIRCVRDFRNVLERRNLRDELPKKVSTFYLQASLPHISDFRGWVFQAWALLDGETRAVEAGFPPMENPSAQNLAQRLEGAAEACNQVDEAERSLVRAQDEMDAVRRDSEQMIRDIAAVFRIKLNGMPAAKQRRIMRSYGFSFSTDGPALEDTVEPDYEPDFGVSNDPVEDRHGEPSVAEVASQDDQALTA